MPKVAIEAGTTRKNRVWIGAPPSCYDQVSSNLMGNKTLHVLHFSVKQAEAVIEMLQDEINRVKGVTP